MNTIPKIKFCGLRTEEDVREALACGVDAVGFVLTESPRHIDEDTCRRLRLLVPKDVMVHGVFAKDDPAEIARLVKVCNLDIAQVHGPDDDEAFWRSLAGLPLVRAYRVRGEEVLSRLEAERGRRFLLDAYVPGVAGGTGTTFDWGIARQAAEIGELILAGGLNASNVADAIRAVRPWMVDVSGGLERQKGVKDYARMRAFAEAVRAVG